MTAPLLDREEYIEQAYFFRTFRARLAGGLPSQDVLATIQEEVLATTRLPLALDFLRGEILLHGRLSPGMARLEHYFTPFQTFILARSEDDRSRFDQTIALEVLEREAEYLAESPTPAGLFIYQFECLARNRLGYDRGMEAMAADPLYDERWRKWIRRIRLKLGATDFADLIYYRSQQFLEDRRGRTGEANDQALSQALFGRQEGRIARANRGKDPLYMFAALQRQLGYPGVPRARPRSAEPVIHPVLDERLKRLEKRIALLEQETSGEFDLSQYYVKPPEVGKPDETGA